MFDRDTIDVDDSPEIAAHSLPYDIFTEPTSTHLDNLAVFFLDGLDVRIRGLHFSRTGNLNGPVVLSSNERNGHHETKRNETRNNE